MSSETTGKSLPEKKIKAGAVSVTIWKNNSAKGSYNSVQINRRYKDASGVWKSTGSLRENDLPKAVLALSKAYEYLVLKEHEQAPAEDNIQDIM